MTTEDDFQKALDANPGDWQTRLVFADWLQERGDPRAEGDRALGVLRRRTDGWGPSRRAFWSESSAKEPAQHRRDFSLPDDWWGLLPEPVGVQGAGGENEQRGTPSTRREAEDAAALAFASLPHERRAELLAPKGFAPAPPAPKRPRKARKPAARKPKAKKRKG